MKTSPAAPQPWACAAVLALAAAAGGLRSDAGWLFFGIAALGGFAYYGPRLAAGQTLAALFFCWVGAAAVFSPEPEVSLAVFGRYALLGLVFFCAAAFAEGRAAWLRGVYAVAAFCAGTLVLQRLGGGEVTGLIGNNPNYSAAFCAAAFPAAFLGACPPVTGRHKLLMAGLALLFGAGVLASGSRGALLAAFLSAAAGLAVSRRWLLLGFFGAAGLGAAALLPGEAWAGLLKFSDPRAFARPRLWGAALDAAAASPLLGWGPGLYDRAFELFKFPFFDGLTYYGHATLHAHSEPLNLAAEAGFPAALLLLGAAARGLLRRGGSLPLKLCALAALTQALADITFYSGAVALLFWGSLGFAGEAERETLALGRGARAALAVALLALLALPFVPGAGRRAYAAAAAAGAADNPALALALPRRAALDLPKDPFLPEAEGRLLLALKDLKGAEAAFSRALALEPEFDAASLGLAQVYLASGRGAQACPLLARAEESPGLAPRTAYQRGLAACDRAAAAGLRKKLCGKRTAGGATAPGRKTR
ncbi:MAG: tetratricopeptide repeat protein [Elusimicrobiales bacterium]|nr:tetratricopeptide repeat protein [Elusimicrobiales bacterium]